MQQNNIPAIPYHHYITAKSIGFICRNLDVSSCPEVSSRGMKWLCYDDDRARRCYLIEKIAFLCTRVTKIGFKTIVLLQRNLTAIHWENSLGALSELSAQLALNGDGRTFPLLELHVVRIKSNACISAIPRAVSICRRLAIVSIEIACDSTMTDENVLRLATMPNTDLKELFVVGAPDSVVTFPNGIAPLLQSSGIRLLILSITCMENVDLIAIFSNCPNLKCLSLLSNTSYVETAISKSLAKKMFFEKLQSFRFTASDLGRDIKCHLPEIQFPIVLGSPKLKSLVIMSCSTLTDVVLERAFQKTRFKCMTHVDLSYCDTITNGGLDHFKKDENSVSFFSIYYCRLVDVARLETEWNAMAKERNWKVKTKFVAFTEFEFENQLPLDMFDP